MPVHVSHCEQLNEMGTINLTPKIILNPSVFLYWILDVMECIGFFLKIFFARRAFWILKNPTLRILG